MTTSFANMVGMTAYGAAPTIEKNLLSGRDVFSSSLYTMQQLMHTGSEAYFPPSQVNINALTNGQSLSALLGIAPPPAAAEAAPEGEGGEGALDGQPALELGLELETAPAPAPYVARSENLAVLTELEQLLPGAGSRAFMATRYEAPLAREQLSETIRHKLTAEAVSLIQSAATGAEGLDAVDVTVNLLRKPGESSAQAVTRLFQLYPPLDGAVPDVEKAAHTVLSAYASSIVEGLTDERATFGRAGNAAIEMGRFQDWAKPLEVSEAGFLRGPTGIVVDPNKEMIQAANLLRSITGDRAPAQPVQVAEPRITIPDSVAAQVSFDARWGLTVKLDDAVLATKQFGQAAPASMVNVKVPDHILQAGSRDQFMAWIDSIPGRISVDVQSSRSGGVSHTVHAGMDPRGTAGIRMERTDEGRSIIRVEDGGDSDWKDVVIRLASVDELLAGDNAAGWDRMFVPNVGMVGGGINRV